MLPVGSKQPQIHAYDPGIPPNGLFWTTAIPDDSVQVNPGAGRASMQLTDFALTDWTTKRNSFFRGTLIPPVPAILTMEIEWNGAIQRNKIRNDALAFGGDFVQTGASIAFSVSEAGFAFVSDPAETSMNEFSVVAKEFNGVFYP